MFSFKPLFFLFHYGYEIVAFFLYLKNKNQLRWKNKIYPLKFAQFVKDRLFGEKNGD